MQRLLASNHIALALVVAACGRPRAPEHPPTARPDRASTTAAVRAEGEAAEDELDVPAAYRALFERDRTWLITATDVVSSAPSIGSPTTSASWTFACRVASVETVGLARVASVTCDEPAGDVATPHGRGPGDAPAGVWIATADGLWRHPHPLSPSGRARVERGELPADERLISREPIAEVRTVQRGDGFDVYTMSTPGEAQWCMQVEATAGHTIGWSLCLGPEGALRGSAFDHGGTSRVTSFTSE